MICVFCNFFRETATIAIKEIAEILGASWLEQNILPSIMQLSNIQNYLYRQTLLYIVIVLLFYYKISFQ